MKSTHGFTFIELIVVVAVIIVSTGISMGSYNNFSQRQQLVTDAQKMVDVLDLARKKSIASDTATFTCADFQGYLVSVNASNYSLNLCCGNSCSPNIPINSYGFNQSIDVTTTQNIQFQKLSGNSTSAVTSTVTVRNQSINTCIPITITSIGSIQQANPCTCGSC